MKTTTLCLIAAKVAADKSPWLTNFDEMLAKVGCMDGPKQCGETNYFSTSGEECGAKRACFRPTNFDHEVCRDVA